MDKTIIDRIIKMESMRKSIITTIVTLLFAISAMAQTGTGYIDGWWRPNGQIWNIVPYGNKVYIGGSFDYVGPSIIDGTSISEVTGIADTAMPQPNGKVNVSIPDGSGGWYIGGDFTMVGNVSRNKLARITSTGAVHSFNPNISGTVRSLVLSGTTLYIGGTFSKVNGINRRNVAAVNTATAAVQTWNPNANNGINCMLLNGTSIYLGGNFDTVGGQKRNRIAAISTSTGLATTWNPNANSTVNAFFRDGATLYVGGTFTTIGSISRRRIAAISTSTGNALTWNPGCNGTVKSIIRIASKVYVGGNFDTLGGFARSNIGAVNANNNVAVSWHPAANGTVNALANSGSKIYIGGDFTKIGNLKRRKIACVDTISSIALSWNPVIDGSSVDAVSVSGGKVYAGGNYESVNGQERNNIAAININNGTLSSWNPNANGMVQMLLADGNKIYACGEFDTINGIRRGGIAALDTATGVPTAWNPNANNTVGCMLKNGSTLYSSGDFTSVGGVSRNRLAAVSTSTGSLLSFNPNVNSRVHTMLTVGGRLYVAGSFSTVSGQSRGHIASFNLIGGTLTSFNPGANQLVYALAQGDSSLYIGGLFTTMGGTPRSGLAVVDTGTGLLTSYNKNLSSNSTITTLLRHGNRLYVGGGFTSIGNTPRNNVAAVDLYSQGGPKVTAWIPNPSNGINDIAARNDTIYIGGSYNSMGGDVSRHNFTAVKDLTLKPTISIAADFTTVCFSQSISFSSVATDTGTGATYTWRRNGAIHAVNVTGKLTTNVLTNGDVWDCIVTSGNPGSLKDTSNAITITVNNCAPANITISPSTTICRGGTVQVSFTANGLSAANIFTAQLSSSTGSFSAPVNIGSVVGTGNGTITATIPAAQTVGTGYRIRVVSSSPALTGSSNTGNLSIVAAPTVAQTTISPSGAASICNGNPTFLSIPGGTDFTYQWLRDNVAIPGATNKNINTDVAGTYKVIASNGGGCSRTSDSVVLTNANCQPVITSINGSSFCQGADFTINFTVPITYGVNNTFKAQLSDANGSFTNSNSIGFLEGQAGSSITATVPYNATPGTNYRVCIISTDPFSEGPDNGSNIEILAAPTAAHVTITNGTGNPNSVCAGSSNAALSVPLNAGVSYQWMLDGNILTGATTNTFTVTESGIYSVLVMNANGCSRLSAPRNISFNAAGTAPDTVSICGVSTNGAAGNLITWIKPISSNIDSFIVYRKRNDGLAFERVGVRAYNDISSIMDQTGSGIVQAYTYAISSKNGCGESSLSATHKTMHLTVNKGRNNNTWNLIWNGYEGMPVSNYTILRGSTPSNLTLLTTIEANAINTFTDATAPSGTILYQIGIANGPVCTATLKTTGDESFITSNIAGSEDAIEGIWNDVTIYPNPATSTACILVQGNNASEIHDVRITDAAGRIHTSFKAQTDILQMFGEALLPGVYLIEVITKDGKRMICKWIKQ